MPAIGDLVHQTSTTTGTGDFTLDAPTTGKRQFSDVFGIGATTNVFWYFISHQTAVEWEVATGHMSATNTLVRDTVIASSNSNSKVSFSAGTKDVCCDLISSLQVINPTTTRGDIITRGASAIQRLGLGSSGQFLYSDGTDAVWRTLLTTRVMSSDVTSTTTTFADVSGMSFTVGASETWSFNFYLFALAGGNFSSAAGPIVALDGPPSPTFFETWNTLLYGSDRILQQRVTAYNTVPSYDTTVIGIGANVTYQLFGTISNGSNSGSLTLRFAAKNSGVNTATLRKGSFMVAERVA
jgi:hypothetical protein